MASAKWTREQVEFVLGDKQWAVENVKPLPYGCQFVLTDGARVNWFTSGKVDVQGTLGNTRDTAKQIFDDSFSSYVPVPKPRVFIAYGHDVQSRDLLEGIIRDFGLAPIILDQLPGGGNTIIEQLEQQTDADFACILLTPDDEGHPAGESSQRKYRARQNVILELGMLIGKLGRGRVAICLKGDLERPTDIEGWIWVPFADAAVAKERLEQELKAAGVLAGNS